VLHALRDSSGTSRPVSGVRDSSRTTYGRKADQERSPMKRALWKGRLVVAEHAVPVKLYAAVEDRKVRFRLLHAKDHAPVEQRIVRKSTGEDVAREARRKAYPIDRHTAVILQPDELAGLEPPAARELDVCRFVDAALLNNQWYDRPYYLGPDGDAARYLALAEALGKQHMVGIARWVMRKKRYLGALYLDGAHLMISTLRRAEQVVSFSQVEIPKAQAPRPSELELAKQLIESISGDFEPQRWHDEHRERLEALIAAKLSGRKVVAFKPKARAPQSGLTQALQASLARAREQDVA
jgi:DNA end-binding protein Ku